MKKITSIVFCTLFMLSFALQVKADDDPVTFFDRTGWTIVTNITGVSDNTVGGNDPVFIIDGNDETSFLFLKRGKTLGSVEAPISDSYFPTFRIDMQESKSFNYMTYAHRSFKNTNKLLRAKKLSIYGSNNSTDSTTIVSGYEIDIEGENPNVIEFTLPASVQYRYITVVIDDYLTTSGNTVQVQEFNVGVKSVSSIEKTSDKSGIRVYPTVVTAGEPFTVTSEAALAGASVKVLSLTGQLLSDEAFSGNAYTKTISNRGVYLIQTVTGGKTHTSKLIVK